MQHREMEEDRILIYNNSVYDILQHNVGKVSQIR